jgi:hypothetical protein
MGRPNRCQSIMLIEHAHGMLVPPTSASTRGRSNSALCEMTTSDVARIDCTRPMSITRPRVSSHVMPVMRVVSRGIGAPGILERRVLVSDAVERAGGDLVGDLSHRDLDDRRCRVEVERLGVQHCEPAKADECAGLKLVIVDVSANDQFRAGREVEPSKRMRHGMISPDLERGVEREHPPLRGIDSPSRV